MAECAETAIIKGVKTPDRVVDILVHNKELKLSQCVHVTYSSVFVMHMKGFCMTVVKCFTVRGVGLSDL